MLYLSPRFTGYNRLAPIPAEIDKPIPPASIKGQLPPTNFPYQFPFNLAGPKMGTARHRTFSTPTFNWITFVYLLLPTSVRKCRKVCGWLAASRRPTSPWGGYKFSQDSKAWILRLHTESDRDGWSGWNANEQLAMAVGSRVCVHTFRGHDFGAADYNVYLPFAGKGYRLNLKFMHEDDYFPGLRSEDVWFWVDRNVLLCCWRTNSVPSASLLTLGGEGNQFSGRGI